MTKNKDVKMLKVALLSFAVVVFFYGFVLLFIPGMFVTVSGSQPVYFGWIRWIGGILISLGIGSLLVFRDPTNQGIFVTTISLGTLLAGLGILYSWLMHEYSGATWFFTLPAIVVLAVSVFLWWSRQQAKEIL
ncbi:MAG: hypothetical protein KAU16_08625 [Methanophagales archaeon]|nr:hypothetical protein [Methanophagales archaeon]